MAARYIVSRAVSAAVNGYGGSWRDSTAAPETLLHWLPQYRRQLKQNDALAICTVRRLAQRGHGCSWMVAPFIGPGPFGRYLPADATPLRIAGVVVMMSPMHVLLAVGGGVTSRRYARRLPHGFRRQGRPGEGPH